MSRRSGSGNRAGSRLAAASSVSDLVAAWEGVAVDLEVVGRDAPGEVDRTVEAQQLLDGAAPISDGSARSRANWSRC